MSEHFKMMLNSFWNTVIIHGLNVSHRSTILSQKPSNPLLFNLIILSYPNLGAVEGALTHEIFQPPNQFDRSTHPY